MSNAPNAEYTIKSDASAIMPEALKFVENYTGLTSDEAVRHVVQVRDRAWDIEPYPCLGRFRFLTPGIDDGSPRYMQVIERIKQGQKLLDMGMCFGQDIRKLVLDGAPSENLYGSDLRADYIELGYTLFKDKDTIKSTFFAADIFDPSSPYTTIDGKIDIVYTGSFFHLFTWDNQIKVAKRIVQVLRPQKGSMVLGRQSGSLIAGESTRRGGTQQVYRHDSTSFARMWKQVGDETGTEWEVQSELGDLDCLHQAPQNASEAKSARLRLRFVVVRK
ncbi:hypothetical protein FRB94_009626 [Tulasnella sp. JGI-2019a]|nr:hypothetical protein FRB94_009626 [Tulasnella sp. JGI-2019a]KAG9017766.1 hypothetical protein FRB93_004577 [Tulasnella sp. JGI-2019a]KAG9035835.1 hypothetical protein FRB95_010429 [Tulasnella sp. JGI-2019a]